MDMSYLPWEKKVLKDDSFIFPLGEILHKDKKWRSLSHEKKTHLTKSCVTMIDLMVTFYEKLS